MNGEKRQVGHKHVNALSLTIHSQPKYNESQMHKMNPGRLRLQDPYFGFSGTNLSRVVLRTYT